MRLVFTGHVAILEQKDIPVELNPIFSKEQLKEVAFFTEQTIHKFVEEESKRDSSVFIERDGQSLRSMSSGERKVALLQYLISLQPVYLYVENFYENLDGINRAKLEELIFEVSKKTVIIQIVRREKERFPFVDQFYYFNKAKGLKPYSGHLASFFEGKEANFSEFSIPSTTTKYDYNYDTFVELTDVVVSFLEKPVLKGVSWEIKLGEFWQLIGENGTGKTTLLSLITGDSHKAYGQQIVLFDKLKGTEENVWEIKQKIGYFTPNITELFNRRHSVLHMVLSGFYDSIGLYVKPLAIHVKLANEWLALLQFTQVANKTFSTLTLAQQRMVLIVRAMVKHPPLLILDEPTSGLDKESTALIVALINKISQETKTTIIYVSHTLEKGLLPEKVFKLTKNGNRGSTGEVLSK